MYPFQEAGPIITTPEYVPAEGVPVEGVPVEGVPVEGVPEVSTPEEIADVSPQPDNTPEEIANEETNVEGGLESGADLEVPVEEALEVPAEESLEVPAEETLEVPVDESLATEEASDAFAEEAGEAAADSAEAVADSAEAGSEAGGEAGEGIMSGISDTFESLSGSLGGIVEPLQGPAGEFLPKVIGAFVILFVAFIIAKIFQWIVSKIFRKSGLDSRFKARQTDTHRKKTLGQMVGKGLFFVIMAFAGISALNTLGLDAVSKPLSGLMDDGFSFIPNLIGAGILGAVAFFLAKFAKTGSASLLEGLDIDSKLKLEAGTVSGALPMVAFGGVLLLFASPVLNALGIDALSQPITALVGTLFEFIPTLLSALVVFGVFAFVGMIAKQFVTGILKATGIDKLVSGMMPSGEGGTDPGPQPGSPGLMSPEEVMDSTSPGAAEPQLNLSGLSGLVPSTIIGQVLFGVIAFMGLGQAVDMLGLEMLSSAIGEVWGFIIPVAVGLAIFGIGYVLAGRARDMVKAEKPELAMPAYYAILVLSGIIGLKRIGVAGALLDYGFGAAALGVAIALGLSFGLGGKDAAAEYLASRNQSKGSAQNSGFPPRS